MALADLSSAEGVERALDEFDEFGRDAFLHKYGFGEANDTCRLTLTVPHLRVATSSDIPELQELIEVSVRVLSKGIYSPAQTEAALVYVFGVDSQLVADGTYYVIDDDTTMVAAGGWSARRTLYGGDQAKGEIDSTVDPATTPARIRAFFVHPDWTRRGLAREIFAECEAVAMARGFRDFELVATLPGEPLYRALGFMPFESISIPLSGNLTLPCVRMHRSIDYRALEIREHAER